MQSQNVLEEAEVNQAGEVDSKQISPEKWTHVTCTPTWLVLHNKQLQICDLQLISLGPQGRRQFVFRALTDLVGVVVKVLRY